MDDIISNIENKIKKWFIKNKKYLLTFLLYILYQGSFLFSIFSLFNIRLSSLSRNAKIGLLFVDSLIYVIILIFMYKKDIKKGIDEFKKNKEKSITIALKCWTFGCVIMYVSSIIISYINKQDISNNEQAVRESIKAAPLYMLFSCSIVAPLFEELVFRRSLKELVKNKWVFIILSGVIFGGLHVIGTYKNPIDILYIIPYGSMGCAFAYLLSKTDNITLPIMVHMIHNTILVVIQMIGR